MISLNDSYYHRVGIEDHVGGERELTRILLSFFGVGSSRMIGENVERDVFLNPMLGLKKAHISEDVFCRFNKEEGDLLKKVFSVFCIDDIRKLPENEFKIVSNKDLREKSKYNFNDKMVIVSVQRSIYLRNISDCIVCSKSFSVKKERTGDSSLINEILKNSGLIN